MLPLSDAALAVFVAWSSLLSGPRPGASALPAYESALTTAADTNAPQLRRDTLPVDSAVLLAARLPSALTALTRSDTISPADTIRRPRQKAIVYSDAYGTRLTIHRRLSWAMLPLFAASYFSGDQLIKDPNGAPQWARTLHRPAATGAALLFGANSVTGYWNLWEGRHDPNNRTRKILHSVLFTTASAGFVYAGTQLAEDAEQSQRKREQHRNVALGSIGISTLSWLIMLIGN